MNQMDTILEATSISKFFNDPAPFKVLDDVSFSVKKGEFLSIVGKSGCGKSTLLYILSTMDTRFAGTLQIKGQALQGQKEKLLARFRNEHLGFVFQFHYLLPEFTVLKNVMLPALKLGRYKPKEVEERALEKLRLVEMDGYAHKLASRLSGGQQQRVAIARALINDPDIIMGDEPTGNLDAANSLRVYEIFRQLAKNGQTIITVTHDPDFARRSEEMQDGKIISA
jgi:lipoprotein-releasing system ATP-binding protein